MKAIDGTSMINSARERFLDVYSKAQIQKSPDTKPRDRKSRENVVMTEYHIIKSKLDKSLFSPAPREVILAYGGN